MPTSFIPRKEMRKKERESTGNRMGEKGRRMGQQTRIG